MIFVDLGADEKTANFPVLYTSSRMGKSGLKPRLHLMQDITPLFDEIISYIPKPDGDTNLPLQMLVTSINWDNYKGRIATGREGQFTTSRQIRERLYNISFLL